MRHICFPLVLNIFSSHSIILVPLPRSLSVKHFHIVYKQISQPTSTPTDTAYLQHFRLVFSHHLPLGPTLYYPSFFFFSHTWPFSWISPAFSSLISLVPWHHPIGHPRPPFLPFSLTPFTFICLKSVPLYRGISPLDRGSENFFL